MEKISGKNDVCREHLLSKITIGIFRPGERLPAERELSESYQVSRSTVRNALSELEEQGIVERRPPVGTFVTGDAMKRIEQLSIRSSRLRAFFVMTTGQIDNPFLEKLFLALKSRLPGEVELAVRLSDSCRGVFEGEKPDIVFLFGNYPEEELIMLSKQIPHLVIWGRIHETLNFVTTDDYAGGKLMAEAAWRAGHRHLAILGPLGTDPQCEFALRARGAAAFCQEHGMHFQLHRMMLEESLNLTAATFFALDHFLREDPALSVVLALRDREAIAMMDCCCRRGLKVPEDISIIGCDDQCFAGSIRPPLTTIRSAAVEIGDRLAGFTRAVLASAPGERVTIREAITPFLVERKSVRILPFAE